MSSSDPSIARGASRMGAATLISRILGLVREQLFAHLFGASNAMDAFNIAFRIPNLLRDLFAEGAMSAAFVPNFTRALVKSRAEAFRLLSGVLVVLTVAVALVAALGMLFCEPLVSLYAGSFRAVPGKFELAVGLTRSMFPFFPLVAMAAVLMGALNALGFFFLPAFAPVLFNVASIGCGLVVVPLVARYTTAPPIYGMAFGVLLGGFLQFYVQWAQVRREGYRAADFAGALRRPLEVPGVKRVLWLMIPGTAGLAAHQLNILINTIYATSAGTGAVSWLNYAFRLMQFPIGIFGVSLAAAALPQVSRRLATGDEPGAGREVDRALRMTMAVNGPAAAGLMAIGLPIVQVLFQHGHFTVEDSRQTAAAVLWYAAGLPGYSAVKVLVPVFYALGTTRVPVVSSFVLVALNALLNWLFLDHWHYPFWSLAAATSATATLNAVILLGFLRLRLPQCWNLGLARSLAVHGALSAAIGFAAAGVARVLSHAVVGLTQVTGGELALWSLEIAAAVAVALMLWWAGGAVLGLRENREATRFIQDFISQKFLAKKLRRTG